ncbi:MAG: hypothetical protein ACXAB0_04490 [Candidatus Thorarchaeota archaeon]|jgi:hypothetical protein
MAEQFLGRLTKIEESINQLGETLKRMITILGTVTEIKSEVRVSKEEIITALGAQQAAAPAGDNQEALASMVVQEVGAVRVFVQESMESLRNEMTQLMGNLRTELMQVVEKVPTDLIKVIEGMPAPAPVAAPTPAPAPQPAPAPAPAPQPAPQPSPAAAMDHSSLPADRAMQIAGHLNSIVKSLKMGCKAGAVLDTMGEAKDAISKIVPSDPIMVHIDRWAGVVGGYEKRKELQARDILKLKKEIKAEIPKYQPS